MQVRILSQGPSLEVIMLYLLTIDTKYPEDESISYSIEGLFSALKDAKHAAQQHVYAQHTRLIWRSFATEDHAGIRFHDFRIHHMEPKESRKGRL